MALDSSSTLPDALAQYNDNLAWEGNASKQILALEAVRWLIANRPVSNTTGDGRTINYADLRAEKARLEGSISRSSRKGRRVAKF